MPDFSCPSGMHISDSIRDWTCVFDTAIIIMNAQQQQNANQNNNFNNTETQAASFCISKAGGVGEAGMLHHYQPIPMTFPNLCACGPGSYLDDNNNNMYGDSSSGNKKKIINNNNVKPQYRCIPCPIGTFSSSTGLAPCLPCPAGKTTVHQGAVNAAACSMSVFLL